MSLVVYSLHKVSLILITIACRLCLVITWCSRPIKAILYQYLSHRNVFLIPSLKVRTFDAAMAVKTISLWLNPFYVSFVFPSCSLAIYLVPFLQELWHLLKFCCSYFYFVLIRLLPSLRLLVSTSFHRFCELVLPMTSLSCWHCLSKSHIFPSIYHQATIHFDLLQLLQFLITRLFNLHVVYCQQLVYSILVVITFSHSLAWLTYIPLSDCCTRGCFLNHNMINTSSSLLIPFNAYLLKFFIFYFLKIY